jgi:ABC-2 type transport system permease protein
MSSMTVPTISRRRTMGMARTNTTVLMRNRLNLSYALLLPLLPLGLLFLGDRGDVGIGISNVSTVLLMALIFPVYYNVLSMVVTRRDELVLKRLRTGEARDAEILLAIAIPGTIITVLVALITVPLSMAAGLPLPVNPLLVLAGILLACATFAALAVWTAAWTRNAEAAQLTSMPVIILATIGLMRPGFPESTHLWFGLTPGAALSDVVRVGWFGRTTELSSNEAVGFAGTWAEVAPALAVLVLWVVIAMVLARRSMRWEPRT